MNLDPQRETGRRIAGMFHAAITAGAGRQPTQQVDFGEKFDVIAGAHRAGLHEILMRVVGEARAHEDVEDIMYMGLCLMQRQAGFGCQGAGQVRMAAMMIVLPAQQPAGVGIAAGADHVVYAAAIRVKAVPIECVMGDRRHGPHMGKTAPHPVSGAQVGAMQRAGLAAVKPLRQVLCRPEI